MADILDLRGRPRVQTVNTDPSETVQSDAHLADIQNIMKRFGQEGLDMLAETDLLFRDVTQFTDLADALNQAKIAEIRFLKLPSKVREVFNHDVAEWLDTAHDQDKRDALVKAGFLKPVDDPRAQGADPVGSPPGDATPQPTAGSDKTGDPGPEGSSG